MIKEKIFEKQVMNCNELQKRTKDMENKLKD